MLDVGYSELDVDLPRERRSSGVKGPGDAAGAADVNTVVPVLEAATGFQESARPAGFAELRQAAEGKPWFIRGFHIGVPGGRWRLSLHLPGTWERAMWAGFIPDVRYVCNNGRAGAVAGRQPFPPSGCPGGEFWGFRVAGATPGLALRRPPAARWPATARARAGLLSDMLRPSVGNRLTAAWWAGWRHGGLSTSVCAWATVMPSRASTTRHW